MNIKTNYIKMANRIKEAAAQHSNAKFVSGMLKAMEAPSSTIKRANLNNDTALARGVYYGKRLLIRRISNDVNMYKEMEEYQQNTKRNCHIVLFFNSDKVYAEDMDDGTALSCKRSDLHNHTEFFFPVVGRERKSISEQQKLDASIGDKIIGLSNELTASNPGIVISAVHHFVTSLVLLLILDAYYGLVKNGKTLSDYLDSHSTLDGNDMNELLQSVFCATNGTVLSSDIKTLDSRLFIQMPFPFLFSAKARRIVLALSALNWAEVKSYVPGAILQSLTTENRSSLTDNYLARENVLRIIGPLFIDEIRRKTFSISSTEDYESFMEIISNIYILNPDSSSGDCIIGCIDELNTAIDAAATAAGCKPRLFPLNHILGIEPDSTAIAISRISLCLSALSWSKRFETLISPKEATDILYSQQIINARSFSIPWDKLFSPPGKVYILGNTQYVGARQRTPEQTAEFDRIFDGLEKYHDIDYSGAYVYAAAKYMEKHDAEAAFVVTNSLTQGSQAATFWKFIFARGAYIRFGWQSFKLRNLGKKPTTVTVVVVGISKKTNNKEKTLFVHSNGENFDATHPSEISPYLVPGNKIITSSKQPIGYAFPQMIKGNMPYDGGHLILSAKEKDDLLAKAPEAEKFIRFCKGSEEVLNGGERYCFYIREDDNDEAMAILQIKERIDQVRLLRLGKKDKSAQKLALRPWSFREENQTTTQSIVIPAVSSENYVYIPMDIIGPDTIVTNLAFVIYDSDEWILGVLMSRMHNTWIKTVCGGLETRIRYSNVLGYNTFPFPKISEVKKEQIRNCVADIYIAREKMIGTTLAQKYKVANMSKDLRIAHQRLDMVINSCYQSQPFLDDEDCLYRLFEMYEAATTDLRK